MEKVALEAAPKLVDYYGPLGVFVLLLIGAVVVLWLAYRGSHKELANLSVQTVSAVKDTSATSAQLAISIQKMDEAGDDRFETLKAMQLQSVALAELVAANAASIKALRDDVVTGFKEMRADVRELSRERRS